MGAPEHNTAVVIAARNAEATLERALRTALAQPETAEVCVVDDASTDGTAALGRAWADRDRRVKVLNFTENVGPAAARNAAIDATTSPWIAILDADDYLLDGRLTGLFRASPDAHFVADALIRVTGAATPALPPQAYAARVLTFTEFVLGNMGALEGPLDLGFIKPVFRRAFLDQHGLRYRADLRLGEDYEFYARALALGARFTMVAATGYVSVEREGSLSKAHSEGDLERLRDCDEGLRTVRALAATERRALDRHWTSVDNRLQWRRLISAVKARDAGAAASAFHSLASTRYLLVRLGEQAWLRGLKALRGAPNRLEMRQDRA
jgi:succinoglycan biosynthesis protein ExoU